MKFEYKFLEMTEWDIIFPSCYDFLSRSFQFAALLTDDPGDRPSNDIHFKLQAALQDTHIQDYMFPTYDPVKFAEVASIMDQAVADKASLEFPPSVLAAACFYKGYLSELGKTF